MFVQAWNVSLLHSVFTVEASFSAASVGSERFAGRQA